MSQSAGTFTLCDSLSYTWTGNGTTSAWSDAGNWNPSASTDSPGYPLCGGDAVFTNGTTAEIVLDVDVTMDDFAVCASDVSVSISAAATRAFNVGDAFIISDRSDATVYGSYFAFDGPINVRAPFISTGKGNHVRFANGATSEYAGDFHMAVQNSTDPYDATLEILSGSAVNIANPGVVYINGNAKVIVDDAEFVVASIIFNAWAPGGTVEVAGSAPSFRVFYGDFRSGKNITGCTGKILYTVPVGGYASTEQRPGPVGHVFVGDSHFGGDAYEPIIFEINKDSPAFQSKSCAGETMLLYSRSSNDIEESEFSVSTFKKLSATCSVDNESSPKTVMLSWQYTNSGFVLIVR